MDVVVLRKRLSSFRSEKGTLTKVNDELLVDILSAWESWTGTAKDFYTTLGVSKMQLGGLMSKAKKLKREGRFAESSEFKEIKLGPDADLSTALTGGRCGIEVAWENGRVIRFSEVTQLVDFLKKVA